MKRQTAVVMMFAIGTFVAAATAQAQDIGWGAIQGSYEMFATGACLHSTEGFSFNFPSPGTGEGTIASPYVAAAKGSYFSSPFLGEGIWTFDSSGHGTMEVTQYCILPDKVTQALMPSHPIDDKFGYKETVPFSYVVDENKITVTIPPPVNLTLVGRISRDHKTMTLLSTMQYQPGGPTGHQVCNIGRILTRVDK